MDAASVRGAFMGEPMRRIVELMNDMCFLTWKMCLLSAACLLILHFRVYIWLGASSWSGSIPFANGEVCSDCYTPNDRPLEVSLPENSGTAQRYQTTATTEPAGKQSWHHKSDELEFHVSSKILQWQAQQRPQP